jgi:hypothetical protein
MMPLAVVGSCRYPGLAAHLLNLTPPEATFCEQVKTHDPIPHFWGAEILAIAPRTLRPDLFSPRQRTFAGCGVASANTGTHARTHARTHRVPRLEVHLALCALRVAADDGDGGAFAQATLHLRVRVRAWGGRARWVGRGWVVVHAGQG